MFQPDDDSGAVMRTFVPASAYKSFDLGQRIGEVLIEQQAATPDQIARAAAEQTKMREKRIGDIFGGGNPQDIFANLFGGGGRRGPRKGQDLQTESKISFRESVFGTTLELRLSTDGMPAQSITARVPAGVNDGAKIRVKGKGAAGEAGPGDLFILLHVKPHPIFSRKGEHITLTLPVTFTEAALGADIKVPTIAGDDVTVRLAPGTPNGRVLRVKGRGIHKGGTTGDLLVSVEVQVPRHTEGKAEEALKAFADATAHEDVRAEFISKASQ